MITVSNQGFWAFGRQKDPIASFKEGSAPKLTPSYPPRLVEGAKTPIGRAGTRSAEQNLRGLPTNEYGKRVAKSGPMATPRTRYNKGQIGRLTGPGFKIPAPIPWTFDAARKRLEGIDAKDAVVEGIIKGPLSAQGYIDLLKSLVKAERDDAQRSRLKAWRDELTRLAATADVYDRQGRMPDADLQRRRDDVHDEIDRWIVARRGVAAAPAATPPPPPSMVGLASAVAGIPASSSAPPPPPQAVQAAGPAEVQRRPTQSNPLAAPEPLEEKKEEEKRPPPPPLPRPSSTQTSLLSQIREGGRPLRSSSEPRPFQLEPEPASNPVLAMMQQGLARRRSQIDPDPSPPSLPADFPSQSEMLRRAELPRGNGVRASLQSWKKQAGVSTSFQGAPGKTNKVLARMLVDDIQKKFPDWR